MIYLGLAVLLAIALVGFGLGGAFGGGSVFESIGKEGTGGPKDAAKIAALEKRLKKDPGNAADWAALTKLQFQAGSGTEFVDTTTGVYTTKGKEQLRRVANAWEHYLKVESKEPSTRLAKDMLNVFSVEALDEPAKEVEALQLILGDPKETPTEEHYYELAYYGYLAHNAGLGDLATKKALSLAPKSRRIQLEVDLEEVKKKVAEEEKGSAATTTAPTTTAPSTTSTTTSSSKTASGGK